MGKCITWTGYTMIGMTLAMLGAPVGKADDASFVAAANGLGFQQSPDYLIKSGQSVCFRLTVGSNADQLADLIMGHEGVSADQAHQFLVLSAHEYCPQFNDRVGG